MANTPKIPKARKVTVSPQKTPVKRKNSATAALAIKAARSAVNGIKAKKGR